MLKVEVAFTTCIPVCMWEHHGVHGYMSQPDVGHSVRRFCMFSSVFLLVSLFSLHDYTCCRADPCELCKSQQGRNSLGMQSTVLRTVFWVSAVIKVFFVHYLACYWCVTLVTWPSLLPYKSLYNTLTTQLDTIAACSHFRGTGEAIHQSSFHIQPIMVVHRTEHAHVIIRVFRDSGLHVGHGLVTGQLCFRTCPY